MAETKTPEEVARQVWNFITPSNCGVDKGLPWLIDLITRERSAGQRLRDRIELMARHHERSEVAYVTVQPRMEHRAIARAFRELLAEHDAELVAEAAGETGKEKP